MRLISTPFGLSKIVYVEETVFPYTLSSFAREFAGSINISIVGVPESVGTQYITTSTDEPGSILATVSSYFRAPSTRNSNGTSSAILSPIFLIIPITPISVLTYA